MKRRKHTPRWPEKKVTFLDGEGLRALSDRGGFHPDEGLGLYTPDGQPLDVRKMPGAEKCGVCGSMAVRAYVCLMDVTRMVETPDGAEVLGLVRGLCAVCESLGPDVFKPAIGRRAQADFGDTQ